MSFVSNPPKIRLYKPQRQNRKGAGSNAKRPPWSVEDLMLAYVLHYRRLGGVEGMCYDRNWAGRYPMGDFKHDLMRLDSGLVYRRYLQRGEPVTWESISNNLRNRVYKMFWKEQVGQTISDEYAGRRFAEKYPVLFQKALDLVEK